jgi:hypothetical protein
MLNLRRTLHFTPIFLRKLSLIMTDAAGAPPPAASNLEAILKSEHCDRLTLMKALENVDEIPMHLRASAYHMLVTGRSTSDVPTSFAEFRFPSEDEQSKEQLAKDIDEAFRVTYEQIKIAVEHSKPGQGDGDEDGSDDDGATMLVKKPAPTSLFGSLSEKSLLQELLGMIPFLVNKTGVPYRSSILRVMGPLLWIPDFSLSDLFRVAYHLVKDYLPSGSPQYEEPMSELFRLILQYHDPEVSIHLDRSHTNAGNLMIRWWGNLFTLIFSANALTPHVLPLWDWLFLQGDPLLGAFIPLVFLMERRRELLSCSGKEEVRRFMDGFSAENIFASPSEVVTRAKIVLRNTPFCTRRLLKRVYLGESQSLDHLAHSTPLADPASLKSQLLSFVALPIDAGELVDTFKAPDENAGKLRPAHLNFVILDCRAEKSFNYARLPTALHVGNDIGFDPKLLDRMVSRFDNARGSHLCVLGTGRELEAELNLLKIIVLHFVQAGFRHVGFADGGFKACIPFVKAGKIEVVRSPDARDSQPPAATENAGSVSRQQPDHSASQPAQNSHFKEDVKHAAAEAKANVEKLASKGIGLFRSWMSKKPANEELKSREEEGAPSPNAKQERAGSTAPEGKKTAGGSDSKPVQSQGQQPSAGPQGEGKSGEKPTAAPPHAASAPQPASKQLFTLGDDDDDDFDLIMSVPVAHQAPVHQPAAAPTQDEKPIESAPPATREAADQPHNGSTTVEPSPVPAEPHPIKEMAQPEKVKTPETVQEPSPPPKAAPSPSQAVAPATTTAHSPPQAQPSVPAADNSASKHHHPFDDLFD